MQPDHYGKIILLAHFWSPDIEILAVITGSFGVGCRTHAEHRSLR